MQRVLAIKWHSIQAGKPQPILARKNWLFDVSGMFMQCYGSKHAEIGTAFVFCFLMRNKDRIAGAGSGATFPEVSGKAMAGIELTISNVDSCAEFGKWVAPLLEQQRCLEEENRQSGILRDMLLSKLMMGEIDVSQVEV